jgi:hypothetical protein
MEGRLHGSRTMGGLRRWQLDGKGCMPAARWKGCADGSMKEGLLRWQHEGRAAEVAARREGCCHAAAVAGAAEAARNTTDNVRCKAVPVSIVGPGKQRQVCVGCNASARASKGAAPWWQLLGQSHVVAAAGGCGDSSMAAAAAAQRHAVTAAEGYVVAAPAQHHAATSEGLQQQRQCSGMGWLTRCTEPR